MHLILIYESKVYILGYIYLSLQNCKLNGALYLSFRNISFSPSLHT